MNPEPATGAGPDALALVRRRQEPLFYVIDAALRVTFRSEASSDPADVLPAAVAEVAADLVLRLQRSRAASETAIAGEDLLIRAIPLEGLGDERRFGVLVERFVLRHSVAEAARRFALTARESDVLEGLFLGESTQSMALRLSLAESTVTEHIRNLGRKTAARKRGEIVAAAMGLNDEPRP